MRFFTRQLTSHRRLYSSSVATPNLPNVVIPKLGRKVSRIGFGAYRAHKDHPHGEALRQSIESGVNIIDTAANFENGASERLIGDTVQAMVSAGQVDRKALTLVTKSGYLSAADIRNLDGDYVQINEKSYHSISPSIVEKQIAQSLERLKTDKIDIFMLNAPERMLMARKRTYTPDQLYKDMAKAFQYLDGLVAAGTIGGYGVCSNSMALPSAADHISLPRILQACAKPENFVAIQVPFNIFEREAIVARTTSLPTPVQTLGEIAKENDIFVMTNRPLNAIANGQIRVLVNHALDGDTEGSSASERQIMDKMSQSFQQVSQMEADMMSELPIEEEALTAKFVWGEVLSENLARLAQNHFAARHYLVQQVLPVLEKDLDALRVYAGKFEEERRAAYDDWIKTYRKGVHALADDIVAYAYIDTLRKNSELDRIMNALSPTLSRQQNASSAHSPLSIKMLRYLLAHDAVGTVFTGMRDPRYVQDALTAVSASMTEPLGKDEIDDISQCPVFY